MISQIRDIKIINVKGENYNMPARVVNYSYTPAKLYPTDEAYPEEVDYDIEVESDISGKDITGEDVWEIEDKKLCSESEMLDYFNKEFVSPVENEEDYLEAKKYLIEERGYKEEDFKNSPKLLKIDYYDDVVRYAFKDDFDPIGDYYLPEDWCKLDEYDLEDIAFDSFDPDSSEYDDREYDDWVDRRVTDEN